MPQKILNTLFWLALSTYFGGLIVIGVIVAPAVFAVSHDSHLSMPGISPPLEMDRQVGGEIFGTILNRFAYAEITCLALILIAIIGWLITCRTALRTWIILILWLLIAATVAYDSTSLRPQMFQLQQTIRTEAPTHATDAANTAWPNRDLFDALHKRSEALAQARVYALLVMMIIAAWTSRRDQPNSQLKNSTPSPPTGTRVA